MHNYLLSAISCLCILPTGLGAEECSQVVLAKRDVFYVPEGGSLSLSCVVQHCGDTWTGNWMWRNSTDELFSTIENSARHRLTNVNLSVNETRLDLNFLRVIQLDEGSYGCTVTWGQGDTDQGHLMYVNITAAVPSQRNLLHRVLVYAGAFLCLPLILGLACCLSPVPQKRSTSSHKAPPKFQQEVEVVYADISKDALRQQRATRESAQSTVYSSVKFPLLQSKQSGSEELSARST
ncbi:uncharacterized protein si:dkey-52l18.4 [Xiphias gladius]|uniref:uncharacterized protein si:dkey-52l18.4 n=1 Tax=Xiphias gladius TaxID=8245 RepID=UPI001A98C6DB|nr:uncharacterized protein si:dkey-52l18.4 [Xiphias gladius]